MQKLVTSAAKSERPVMRMAMFSFFEQGEGGCAFQNLTMISIEEGKFVLEKKTAATKCCISFPVSCPYDSPSRPQV